MLPVLAQLDIGNEFSNALARVVELTPKILLFLVILIVGWIGANGRSERSLL